MASDRNELYREGMDRGQRLANAARWPEAVQAYRAAVRAMPHDATARIRLAFSLYHSGDLSQAYQEYEVIAKLSPGDRLILTRMADIQHKLGRFDQATELLLRVADIHIQQKQRDKALDVWRRVAETYSENRACLELLKKACARAGEKQLEAEVELALAYVYAEIADHKQAVQACKRAIEADGANEKARQILKSLENGTADWRSFRLLDQFKVKVDVRKGIAAGDTYAAEAVTPPDVPAPSSDPSLKPGSLRELEGDSGQGSGRARMVRWYLSEAERYQQNGDVVSAIAVLCKALEDNGSDEGDDMAAVRQRIDSMLSGREQLRVDELVNMPFEDRKAALGGMLSVDEYLGQGQKLAAIDTCLGIIERIPDYLPAQMRLANIYVSEGEVEAAREKYSYVAQLYKLRNDSTRAAEATASLVDLCEDDSLREKLATSLMEQGSLDRALKQMMRIVDRYLTKNNQANALSHLSKMLQLAPNRADINVKYAEVAAAMGNHADAKAAYAKALAIEPNNEDIVLSFVVHSATLDEQWGVQPHLDRFFGAVASDAGFAKKVAERLSSEASAEPEKKELKLCMGAALRCLGKADDAAPMLRGAIGDPGYVDAAARYFLASILMEKGESGKALDVLSTGLDYFGGQDADPAGDNEADEAGSTRWLEVSYLRLVKDVYQKLGNKPAALTVLKRMKKIVPDDEEVYLELAGLYFDIGQSETAVQELDQLSKLLLSRNDRNRVIAAYQSVIERAPDNVALRRRLHDGFKSLGFMNEAAEQLELIVDMELAKGMVSEAAKDLLRLIEIYKPSDPEKVLAARERFIELKPEDTASRQELVASYLRMGLANKALSEASKLAKDLVARGKQERAIDVMQEMVKLDPWNVWALEHLGDLLAAMGRRDESIKVYRRLLDVDPRNVVAKKGLAGVEG